MTRLRVVIALLALGLSACTTLRPLDDFSPSSLRADVHVGDHIKVTTLKGAAFELEVTQVDADRLHGVTPEGKPYYVDFEVIRSIEVERVQGWKVATGFAAVLNTLAVVAVLAVIYAFSHL